MTLDRHQREHLADKSMDGANLILTGVVIAGFIDQTATPALMVGAALFYFFVVVVTTGLRKGG